jgi:hypothetical protein
MGRRVTTNVTLPLSEYWPGFFAVRGFFAASGSTGRTRNFLVPDFREPLCGQRRRMVPLGSFGGIEDNEPKKELA